MAEFKKKPRELTNKKPLEKNLVVKKPTPKTSKKSTATKAVKTRNIRTSSKLKSILSPIQITKADEVSVSISSSASLRLLEKVELYKTWYQEILPKFATKTARFSGYSFIFLGVLFSAFGHLSDKDLGIGTAALVCSLGECSEVKDNVILTDSSHVNFIDILSPILENDTNTENEAEDASSFIPEVISLPNKNLLSFVSLESQITQNQLNSEEEISYFISGKSTPNSLVSLKQAESLTVIRADSTGQFTYIFKKDSAESNDINFVISLLNNDEKYVTTNLNSAIDYNNLNLLASASGLSFKDAYSKVTILDSVLIGSIGLLALGFILLFLAQRNPRSKNFRLKINEVA